MYYYAGQDGDGPTDVEPAALPTASATALTAAADGSADVSRIAAATNASPEDVRAVAEFLLSYDVDRKLFCKRGTSALESLHRALRRVFNGFAVGPELGFALITEFFFEWNIKRGANRRGCAAVMPRYRLVYTIDST
jgi:hypothetical protein